MDCPHCGKAFHDTWKGADIVEIDQEQDRLVWRASGTVCPACGKPTIALQNLISFVGLNVEEQQHVMEEFRVYPRLTFRAPPPEEVTAGIRDDYEEAANVLSVSNKASAALSRRCLQAVLREQGYNQKDLAQQIDALLGEQDATKVIPTALRQTVDAIRNFGNFSAHPITDRTTLQVIDVEPEEAEWCLEILDELFDHFYVKPAQAAQRKAALDAKLAAAGKKPSKS